MKYLIAFFRLCLWLASGALKSFAAVLTGAYCLSFILGVGPLAVFESFGWLAAALAYSPCLAICALCLYNKFKEFLP